MSSIRKVTRSQYLPDVNGQLKLQDVDVLEPLSPTEEAQTVTKPKAAATMPLGVPPAAMRTYQAINDVLQAYGPKKRNTVKLSQATGDRLSTEA